MSAVLTQLAWAVCHPRAGRARRRPECAGSRSLVAGGCVHDGKAWCPRCRRDVDATAAFPRVVRLEIHATKEADHG